EADIRKSDEMLQSSIDALSAHIAVLDEDARIIVVNESWRRFALENGFRSLNFGIGESYLYYCDVMGGAEGRAIAEGIRAVLHGVQHDFHTVYACDSPVEKRWFQLRVTSFQENGRKRLVVSHEDVTEVKRAEESLRDLADRILESQEHERRR